MGTDREHKRDIRYDIYIFVIIFVFHKSFLSTYLIKPLFIRSKETEDQKKKRLEKEREHKRAVRLRLNEEALAALRKKDATRKRGLSQKQR